jgi:hypothetical protein
MILKIIFKINLLMLLDSPRHTAALLRRARNVLKIYRYRGKSPCGGMARDQPLWERLARQTAL